jgi:hypothetical protein
MVTSPKTHLSTTTGVKLGAKMAQNDDPESSGSQKSFRSGIVSKNGEEFSRSPDRWSPGKLAGKFTENYRPILSDGIGPKAKSN